jgi:Zn-dependent protease with chaperone function
LAAEPFTAAQRSIIDDNALWSPRERQNLARVEGYGSALAWMVARTPLPVEEEIKRAKEKDAALRQEHATAEPSPEALAIFEKLVAELPARMRSKDYAFTLTVVEGAKVDALTLGAGRVYVNAELIRSATPDELAFTLAHELGHHALGHPRRIYQRLWLFEGVQKDAARKDPKAAQTWKQLAGVGTILEYVYTREEKFQADLFAVQLCRSAGFDVEAGLDGLRRQAVKADAALLKTPAPRAGFPPVEPEVTPQNSGEQLTLAAPPTAAQRLRRLRLELDGLIYGESYGLFEYDRATKSLKRAADKSLAEDDRVIVCVHGMESSLGVYVPLMEKLAALQGEKAEEAKKARILGFQYPADESLFRVSRFLKREMQRVCSETKHVDFVCHSAGGLVCRHYVEVDHGNFHWIYFQGTPHGGSDLATLRSLLEVLQFAGDLKLGYDGALHKAIMDGHGQISYDLLPGSLFLTCLNRQQENLHRERYSIDRGQAYSKARVLLLQAALEAARTSLERTISRDPESSVAATFAKAGLGRLVLPAEIASGDLCVTLENAGLEGVTAIETHALKHTELPRNPKMIEELAKKLLAD